MPDRQHAAPYPPDRSAFEVVAMHAPDDALGCWTSRPTEGRVSRIESMRMVAFGTDPR